MTNIPFSKEGKAISLLDSLADPAAWAAFREYRSLHSLMSQREFDELDAFIAERRYMPLAETLRFSLPEKRLINKSGSRRKRTVYLFPRDETWVLKLLTWLMYRYDYAFRPSCFSFRKGYTAKTAFGSILAIPGLNEKWVLKADIHDYFNSMPVSGLVRTLSEIVTDDPPLLDFLTRFFSENRAMQDGKIVEEERGAMAGVPLSAFCANVYLASLDEHFERRGVPCFRYSDDILLLCGSREELDECFAELKEHVEAKGLTLNPDKLSISAPGEAWDYLGFKYRGGKVDLADATVMKMKGRIKRKAHALYRWKLRKGADYDRTARAMIRKFNRKFYDIDEESEFTWSRWFFPVLSADDGLRELDAYLTEYLRYLYSGRHYKGNYAVSYEHLKELGFRSLVGEFYKYKKTGVPR